MEKHTYCKKCGYMLFPEDTVCPRCGYGRVKKKKSSWLIYLIVLLPLILIMSAVCGFYLLGGDSGDFDLSSGSTPSAGTPVPTEKAEEQIPAQQLEEAEIPADDTAGEDNESGEADEGEEYTEPDIPAEEVPQGTPAPYQTTLSEPDKYGHTGKLPPKFTAYKASSAAEDVYSAGNAFDADMDTVWGTGGNGIGEWITMSAEEYQAVSGVRIYNGNTRSEELFKENSRIKIVEISFSDGSYIRRILQDGFSRNEPQIIRFGERINTKYLKITILDKYGDSDTVCVGEISVF